MIRDFLSGRLCNADWKLATSTSPKSYWITRGILQTSKVRPTWCCGPCKMATSWCNCSGYKPVSTPLKHTLRRSEEHTSELQSRGHLVCRLLLEKKKNTESN